MDKTHCCARRLLEWLRHCSELGSLGSGAVRLLELFWSAILAAMVEELSFCTLAFLNSKIKGERFVSIVTGLSGHVQTVIYTFAHVADRLQPCLGW